ncbi:MAG: class I SAM-dependent methyltransferase [Peptococcaceae bacterium]|nr:class I SAM-dependent methyltransferase [Peptococcaceae bacterium]
MDSYRGLAAVYDRLVAGVDFDGWIDYVESLLRHFGYGPGSVLDLACGTGNTLLPFARRGYRAIGVDISPEMIACARQKAAAAALSIDYYVGDAREFLLRHPVDLVTCFHDGLNYITEAGDLARVFKNTARNLVPGGMFIFDMNAVKWIGEGDNRPVVIDEGDMTIIYSTAHDTDASLWTVDLTCFIKEGDLYRKFSERHRERGYEQGAVLRMLESAGFNPMAVYDAFSFNPPHPKSRRHFYVARSERKIEWHAGNTRG